MGKPIIREGDTTSHGGTVLEAFPKFSVYGKNASGIGHQVYCPKCKGNFPIVAGVANYTFMGKNVAVEGMQTSCGATLVASQRQATVANILGSNLVIGAALAYDMHWELKGDKTGQPLANIPYKITLDDGTELMGQTDKNGLTQKISADSARLATIIAPYCDEPEHDSNEIDADCGCCADCD